MPLGISDRIKMVLWPGCGGHAEFTAFTQRTCDRCGSLWKGGDVVATSPVVLRWLCDSPLTGCAWRITPLYMQREQAIVREIASMISVVACCHGAKLCAHAAWVFRSQHYYGENNLPSTLFKICTEFNENSVCTRGGRSHFFRLRLCSCSKIFESGPGSGSSSNLRIRLLLRIRLQSLIQP